MTTQPDAPNPNRAANETPDILPKILEKTESADSNSLSARSSARMASEKASKILELLTAPPADKDPLDGLMDLLKVLAKSNAEMASEVRAIRQQQDRILERLSLPR